MANFVTGVRYVCYFRAMMVVMMIMMMMVMMMMCSGDGGQLEPDGTVAHPLLLRDVTRDVIYQGPLLRT